MLVLPQNEESDKSQRAEISVKNSRFISELTVVRSQQEARAALREKKERYADASHVVHAFVIGRAGEILGCSDDGEPAGTAGRPVLEILKGRGVTDVLLTVTRYFGGTLLGTGGLVRAYGDAARAVLDAVKFVPFVALTSFTLHTAYDMYIPVKRLLDSFDAHIISEEFAESVRVEGTVPEGKAGELAGSFRELVNGRSEIMYT